MHEQRTESVETLRIGLPAPALESATSRIALLRLFEWSFLAFIASLPLMQLGLSLRGGTATLADLLFVAVLLVGALAIVFGAMRFQLAPLYLWILLYLGLAAVSAALGDWPLKSAARFPIEIYMAMLAVVCLHAVDSVQAFRRVAVAWMIGTALTVAAGLFGVVVFYSGYQPSWRSVVIDHYGSLPPGNYPRVHGLFLNMNMCCDYLVVSLLLLLLCWKLRWVRCPFFVALMLGICITAVFTVSLGIGGLLLAAGMWFWRQRDRRSAVRRSSLAIGIIGASSFFLASIISPINSGERAWRVIVLNGSLEPSSRALCWGEAYRIWQRKPLLGRGAGLEVPCPTYRDASGETQQLLDAHNMFLNTLATKGTLGLFGLLGILLSALWPILPVSVLLNRDLVEIYAVLRIAVICAFLYGGLSGSFEHTRHLWVLLGLLVGAQKLAAREVLPIQNEEALDCPSIVSMCT